MTNATARLLRAPLGSLLLLLAIPCQSPAAEMRGRVLDPAGAPIASALLEAKPASGLVLRTQSDGSGAFQISGLPDGLIRLHVSREGFSPSTREFDLASPTGEITITLAVSRLRHRWSWKTWQARPRRAGTMSSSLPSISTLTARTKRHRGPLWEWGRA